MASQSSEWPGAVEGPGLVSAHILTAQEVQLREGARIAASLREAVHTKCGKPTDVCPHRRRRRRQMLLRWAP
jgi:hypothetical protein